MLVIRSAALVLSGCLLILVSGPANADVRKYSDRSGDVQYVVNNTPPTIPPPVAVPTRTAGDITGIRVTHSAKKVQVVTYFRSLSRTDQFHGHVFRFVAGTFQRKAQIAAGPDYQQGWKGLSEMSTTSDRPVACRGMKYLIDYAHRRVVLNVPRSCLRKPKSIRVGVGAVILANDRTYFDDGYGTGGKTGMEALKPTLGPAVAR